MSVVGPPLLRQKARATPESPRRTATKAPTPGLPRLDEDEDSTLTALTRRLEAQRGERLAQELDPDAAEVARLRRIAGVARTGRSSPPDATRPG